MENSFATIKDTSYSYRIQVSMPFQSYNFPIPMVFLSYESKEPLFLFSFAKSAFGTVLPVFEKHNSGIPKIRKLNMHIHIDIPKIR
jgi:hypothetical protein